MTRLITPNETVRLAALKELQILDTARHPDFDDLVDLARELFDVPIGLISLIDSDRQWFKASAGIDLTETSRETAFCDHTIRSTSPLLVYDAQLDSRFRENPFVTGDPKIRFYAGVPLALEPGINLGSLCIIDVKPRTFDESQLRLLRRLGDIAHSLLRQHKLARDNAELSQNTAEQIKRISDQSASLEKQKRLLDCASDLAKMGAWELDLKTDRLEWSDGLFSLHEMDRVSEIKVADQLALYPQAERARVERAMTDARRNNSGFSFEAQMFTAKGNLRWVRVVADVELEDGIAVRHFGMKQDITEQKVLTERVLQLARCDELTGLLNRRALREKLVQLSSDNGNRPPLSLFLFDLDGFKDINDSNGHAAGDACLRRIARRVKSVAGTDCMVARIGGDEFAVLNFRGDSIVAQNKFVSDIQAAITRPIRWRGNTFQVSSSLGIAGRASTEQFGVDEILREADLALYEAKRSGRNCHRAFTYALNGPATRRLETLAEVRHALASNRLELYYQPKINLAYGRVVGFEALLRLNLQDGSVLAPGSFAAALEDPALSKAIGDFVASAAISQAKQWQNCAVPFGSIAINLSASQFIDPDFAQKLLAEINEASVPLKSIEIELTEGVVLSTESESILSACRAIHNAGIRIAFDDFGTGFASLTHLRDFPVDILKIDRSFITDLTSGGNATAIVNAMVGLGRNLSMSVVAEGVETEDQAEFLSAIGCDIAQGYFFGRPMKAGDVPNFLNLPNRHKERA